ncbi:MAG: hypothetical protein R3257_01625 [bacterium]|nr:hypothetical protein [bacterium]
MVICHACGTSNDTGETVGRRETCSQCGADLHVCLNCEFYDPKAYNECHEPQADRVVDKDRSNFCDYFKAGSGLKKAGGSEQEDAKKKLEALFKKKS